jgi:cytochrome b561
MTAAAAPNQRYTTIAIALHWLIAFAIIGMIALGWYMTSLPGGGERRELIQLHKSIGITILLLSISRVIWRLMNPPPPEPAMPGWQAALAKAVHIGLYVLIILMPLSGWIMASASPQSVGTMLYKTLPWPHVPGLAELPVATKKELHDPLEFIHSKLAWVAISLLVLHVAGALKHQFVDRDGLLARIAPGLFGRTAGPPAQGRGLLYAFGAALVLLAAGTGYAMVGSQPAATPVAETNDGPPGAGPAQSASPAWTVDATKSSIVFKGAYFGRPFQGAFKNWTSDIQFDPANPADARIRVVVKTESATTDEPYFNDSLKEGDWFDARKHPDAVFSVTKGVKKTDDTHFEAAGTLSIKAVDYPLTLPFTLNINGDTATMHSEIKMSRTGLTIGKETPTAAVADNPDKEWVADEVALVVDVVAKRQ